MRKIKRPSFYINQSGNKLFYSILFVYRDVRIDLDLSNKEWKNWLRFLKLTKSKKKLPKDKDGYWGMRIDTGEIQYYSAKVLLEFSEDDEEDLKRSWEKQIKKEVKGIKGKLMTQISLYHHNLKVRLFLSRKDFITLRETCLNPKSIHSFKRKEEFK